MQHDSEPWRDLSGKPTKRPSEMLESCCRASDMHCSMECQQFPANRDVQPLSETIAACLGRRRPAVRIRAPRPNLPLDLNDSLSNS